MADERNPRCVKVVEEMEVAQRLAEWLADQGFPATAVLPDLFANAGDSLGLAPETFTGFEVRVAKPEHVEPALQALEDRNADLVERLEKVKKRSERTGTVTAVCEECGKESEWPAAAMGTTETCPHCDAFMDVPDPDDDWGDVDFGEEEADNESEGE